MRGMPESLKEGASCSVGEVEFARSSRLDVVSDYLVNLFTEGLDIICRALISYTVLE